MRRSILYPATAALFILTALGAARAADQRTASGTRVGAANLAIDGVFAGYIGQWEGGEIQAAVATDASSAGGMGKKHVTNVQASPLVVELDFPPMPSVVAWINEFCAGQTSRKSLIISAYDSNNQPLPSTEYANSQLTEVRFPALDTSSTAKAKITLVFAPGQIRPSPQTISGSEASRGVAVNSFALAIGPEIDGRAVSKIDAFTVKSSGATDNVGAYREPTMSSGPVTSSNLILTLLDSSATNWKAWIQSFLVQGNHLDADEKDGAITFRGAGRTDDVSLKFSHMGILRLAHIPGPTGSVLYDQAEVYFEGLTLTGPTPPAATSSTSTAPAPAATTPAASTPATQTPADATPATPAGSATPTTSAGAATATTPAGPSAATTGGKAADLEPASPAPGRAAAGKTSALTGTDTPAAVVPAGADVGPRDPAGFPRLGGTVRTFYSANTGKMVSDESATYTTGADFDQVVAFCDSQPKSAGWEEVNRSETTRSASGRTMIIDWRKPQKTAQVRLNPLKGGGTEIWLTVTTQHAPK